MPTGYTSLIKDGISFEKFVFECSQAFIPQARDEHFKDWPEFKPSTEYHQKGYDEALDNLGKYSKISDEDLLIEMNKKYDEEVASIHKYIEEHKDLLEKYVAMRSKVSLWIPPTSDHEGLKKFMLEQIDKSIEFDCESTYYKDQLERMAKKHVNISLNDYRKEILDQCSTGLQYHKAEMHKEEVRISKTNLWVNTLKNSVKES